MVSLHNIYPKFIETQSTGSQAERKKQIHIDNFILLFPFWLPLEHLASMKLSVSLQFFNLGQSVGLLGRVISSSQDLYVHGTTQT
jgi:hypothetical protein